MNPKELILNQKALNQKALNQKSLNQKSSSANIVIIIPILILLFNIFLHPQEMILAAREGLQLWFNQVIPSILPFVAGANLLAALGFIHFAGALMAPIMVPIFKVPGSGAFALLTGFASGYPMGAKAVAYLLETGQIEKDEAQRLIAFTNNAGPLFVIGFVGAGLFGSVRIGNLLLISHITAAIAVGLLVRFLFAGQTKKEGTSKVGTSKEGASKEGSSKEAASKEGSSKEAASKKGGLKLAFKEYQLFHKNHYKGFGQALGTSVRNAMDSMVLIGGFIIIFCVVIEVIEITIGSGTNSVIMGFAAGIIEVANGARMIAQGGALGNLPPGGLVPPGGPVPFAAAASNISLAATSAIISFGGLSVHGQTAHFIRNTDIKFAPYLAAKGLQALISAIISFVLFS